MPVTEPHPCDVEAVLVPYLAERLQLRVVTELPEQLDQLLPVVRLATVGGGDDMFRLAETTLDVDVFGATRLDAAWWAEVAHQMLRQLDGQQAAGIVFTRVRATVRPRWLEYDNPNLRRWQATYQLMWHPASDPAHTTTA